MPTKRAARAETDADLDLRADEDGPLREDRLNREADEKDAASLP